MIHVHIEPGTGVALITCGGTFRAADAKRSAAALWENPDWPGTAAVWDCRNAQFDVSANDVHALAQFILANQRALPPERMTFVIERDFDFGMARMFEAYRDHPRTDFRVLRDLDEALEWARGFRPQRPQIDGLFCTP